MVNKIVYIVYQDLPTGMVPLSKRGVLRTFPTYEEAASAKPWLGVISPINPSHIPEILEHFRLKPPKE